MGEHTTKTHRHILDGTHCSHMANDINIYGLFLPESKKAEQIARLLKKEMFLTQTDYQLSQDGSYKLIPNS